MSADGGSLVKAAGAQADEGIDVYASATKIFLSESVLANAKLCHTSANQICLLGFMGHEMTLQPEVSLSDMRSGKLSVGGEYRVNPDNLAFAREDDYFDFFGAYAVNENLTLTAGHVDLGSIAIFDNQNGLYLSGQIGY